MDTFTVALVGRRLPDNENLGLAYLAAALKAAGLRPRRYVLNDASDMDRIAGDILARGIRLSGLSLADGGSAYLPLALGDLLRRRGYTGHITAGGQFATLARHWLLERYPWLDSVVRHAGEVPLAGLARNLAAGDGLTDVPGVTTRQGDGPPAPVLDDTPARIWPEHDDLPSILGHSVAHVALSRGCRGRCGFCGPAAILDLEVEEGLEAGADRSDLRSAGVGGVKRRRVADVCDEMAHLWHESGVRYFYLVDEHPLPWSEPAALDFLERWKQGLSERGVGRLGIGVMLRADRITPPIAEALADLGLVRAFVGIELATPEETRRYGRAGMARNGPGLIQALDRLSVATIANLMLVHPYSSPETIRAGIDFLDQLPAGLFEATQMKVYHGTRLHHLMEEEGRLAGNPLRYGYTLHDPVVARFAEIFTRLRAEAFEDYSLAYRAFDVRLGIALERRLRPGRDLAELEARCAVLARRINGLRTRAMRQALDLADAGAGFAGCSDLVHSTGLKAALLRQEADRIAAALESGGERKLLAPMRAAAAAALQVCLMGGAQAGCDTVGITGTPDASTDTRPDTHADTVDAVDTGHDGACTESEIAFLSDAAMTRVLDVEPCFLGTVCLYPEDTRWRAYLGSYDYGMYLCGDEWRLEERMDRVEAALTYLVPDCTLESTICANVTGGEADDYMRMNDAVWTECGWMPVEVVVSVDSTGRVVDVRDDPPGSLDPVHLDCIRMALSGLLFPCLAGFDVCREDVIIE